MQLFLQPKRAIAQSRSTLATTEKSPFEKQLKRLLASLASPEHLYGIRRSPMVNRVDALMPAEQSANLVGMRPPNLKKACAIPSSGI